MVKNVLKNPIFFLSEFGVFATWREEFPIPRIFDSRNTKAARYDKHVGVSYWIAILRVRF